MNKILIISLLLISNACFCSQFSLKLGHFRAGLATFASRFSSVRTLKNLIRPAQVPVDVPNINPQNPPSLMKAVHEQNHELIAAALKAGVQLDELTKGGGNASAVASQNLQDYDATLVAKGLYKKEFFIKRKEYQKTVQAFDDYRRLQLQNNKQ